MLACSLLAPIAAQPARAQDLPHLKIALNPKFPAYLPIFVGIDKGYFKAAGVDVEVVPFFNSSVDQLPALIRGDIDMMPILASPAFFNGYQNGINLKLLASTSQATTQKGYADVQVVMVRKDLWDSGAIRKLSDLRGKTIDGATRSSALHVLALNLLQKARLTEADVKFGNKSPGPADQYAALANKAVDVQMTTEPNATALQQKGIAVKWLTAADVMPWFQDSYLAVNTPYLQPHREMLQKFLNGYVRAVADIQRSHGTTHPRTDRDPREVGRFEARYRGGHRRRRVFWTERRDQRRCARTLADALDVRKDGANARRYQQDLRRLADQTGAALTHAPDARLFQTRAHRIESRVPANFVLAG